MNRTEIIKRITINLFYILGLYIDSSSGTVMYENNIRPILLNGKHLSTRENTCTNSICMDIFNEYIIRELYSIFITSVLLDDFGLIHINTVMSDNRLMIIHEHGTIVTNKYKHISLAYIELILKISGNIDISEDILKYIDCE